MKYGLLSYKTENVGDEIQSLAALRFLPRVDCYVDRDRLGYFRDDERVAVILNGWFSHSPETWPPSESIAPLLTSFHVSPLPGGGIAGLAARDFFVRKPVVEYLRNNGPIGARDLYTLELLQEHDVPAYFSGCLTLTLQRNEELPRTEDVVLNDVPDEVFSHIRARTERRITHTTHRIPFGLPTEMKFARARALLDLYQSAHCVITTRLHCALPCLALGTPVVLLDVSADQVRFSGLHNLLRHCSVADFLAGKLPFDIDEPRPNSDEYTLLRASLEDAAKSFVGNAHAAKPVHDLPHALRYQTLLHVHADLLAKRTRVDTEHDDLVRERDRLANEREDMTRELAARTAERDALENQLASRTNERDRLRAELVNLVNDIKAIREENTGLQEHLSFVQNTPEWRALRRLRKRMRESSILKPTERLLDLVLKR